MCLAACGHLKQEVFCECSVLDVCQDLLHCFSGLIGDDLRTCDVVAVLSGVGYGVTHSFETGLIDQVYDELHLMDALEVCISRIVACLDQCLEACLHQSGNAAAEDCLLTEEVCLCLNTECGLKKAGSCAADAEAVCHSQIFCLAGIILFNCDQARCASASQILTSYSVSRCLRCDHCYIYKLRRNNLFEMDVKSMCKHQHVAFLEVRKDIVLVKCSLLLIIDQNHDDISHLCGFCCCINSKSLLFCFLPGLAALIQTDTYITSGLLEVQCMCMTLAAVTDDGDLFSLEQGKITIFLIKNLC